MCDHAIADCGAREAGRPQWGMSTARMCRPARFRSRDKDSARENSGRAEDFECQGAPDPMTRVGAERREGRCYRSILQQNGGPLFCRDSQGKRRRCRRNRLFGTGRPQAALRFCRPRILHVGPFHCRSARPATIRIDRETCRSVPDFHIVTAPRLRGRCRADENTDRREEDSREATRSDMGAGHGHSGRTLLK